MPREGVPEKQEVTAVSREAIWEQSCKRENEIARAFKENYGFMVDPNPPPPRDLEATVSAKYYSHSAWVVRPKTIPSIQDISLKPKMERTFISDIASGNHTVRLGKSQARTNPMFVTTGSRYGSGEPFDVYSLQGPRIDSTDVTNAKKIGIPLVEAWGLSTSSAIMYREGDVSASSRANSLRF